MIKVVVFDYGHTLLNNERAELYEGAITLLDFLEEKNIKIGLISGTNKEEFRLQQLNEFGIFPYFSYINFLPHEDTKDFRPILNRYKVEPEEVLVVGDRITSEITEGKKLGMKTCRVLQGPEKNFIPQNDFEKADYTIEGITEISQLIN